MIRNEVLSPYRGDNPFIFVSYSHKSKSEALEIIKRLQQEGYRVWYDEGINPGSQWSEMIATHIDKSGYFMPLLSPEYVKSSNCLDELYYACDLEKPRLVIYLTDEVELTGGMQMRLNRWQAIHKQDLTEEEFYGKIAYAKEIDVCRTSDSEEIKENEILFISSVKRGVDAKGYKTQGGFVVLKGSTISNEISNVFRTAKYNKGNYSERLKLIESGIIIDNKFVKDYQFSSPSKAASVILGRNSNGPESWKKGKLIHKGDTTPPNWEEKPPYLGEEENKILYLSNAKKGVEAQGYKTQDGFVILKGSIISKEVTDGFKISRSTKKIYQERLNLIQEGVIVEGRFVQDYTSTSSSRAASILLGRSASGPDWWKENEELSPSNDENQILYLSDTKKGVEAQGFNSQGKFIIKKGSTISNEVTETFKIAEYSKGIYDERLKLIQSGIIVDNMFVMDYEVNSPSRAAAILLERSASGRREWKKRKFTSKKKINLQPEKDSVPDTDEDQILYLSSVKKGVEAKGYTTQNNQFIVLKGSIISKEVSNSFKTAKNHKSDYLDRLELIRSGVIIDNKFVKDCCFSSSTKAASIILGRNLVL